MKKSVRYSAEKVHSLQLELQWSHACSDKS